MENLIAYLDESLVPLEQKVQEYLELEREIRQLEVKIMNIKALLVNQDSTGQPGTISANGQSQEEEISKNEQLIEIMLQRYHEMQSEIIKMLPEQNKFIEINLGYGPSMIGYFTVDHETHTTLPEPVLRVVH